AYLHFPSIAKEFETPILMCNSIGFSDNFIANGLSSIWNSSGELIGQLNDSDEGILIWDAETQKAEVEQYNKSK
ncbi:MAG: hypothetical protein AB8B52_03790, partial [Winogradskyella sp.]